MSWEFVIQVLIAVGTVGAVVVALFGKEIKSWFIHPKIIFDCIDRNCIHKFNASFESSLGERVSDNVNFLRIKVINNGNFDVYRLKISCVSIKINDEIIYPFETNYFVWSATHSGNPNKGDVEFNLAKKENHFLDLFEFLDEKGAKAEKSSYKPLLKSIPIEYPKLFFIKDKNYLFDVDIQIFGENLKYISGKIKFEVMYSNLGKIEIKNYKFQEN